jgi:hypothetical protein
VRSTWTLNVCEGNQTGWKRDSPAELQCRISGDPMKPRAERTKGEEGGGIAEHVIATARSKR